MKVVIVGSGNVATAIALALSDAKIAVTQVWSKQYHNAAVLADRVNAKAINDLNEIDKHAGCCIIAVKDDAIQDISRQLKDFEGLLVHTSGSVSIDVLATKGDRYGVLYPLQTFSKERPVDFKVVPLCIEGDTGETRQTIEQLAKKLSSTVLEVASDKRKILHLSAVFACNFTNHLYALSAQLLNENNLSFDLLKPLIAETAAKVQGKSLPQVLQTGPAIRNDLQTLRKHEELLADQTQLLNIYQLLSESIKKSQK